VSLRKHTRKDERDTVEENNAEQVLVSVFGNDVVESCFSGG
jgi:hypothetical protein